MQRFKKSDPHSFRKPLRHPRTGNVQFELVMFLPLYAVLLMSLLTLCSFTRSSRSTVIQARHKAWLQQELTGTATQPLPIPQATHLARILNDSQPAYGGLLVGDAKRPAFSFLRFLDPRAESQYTHYVLTDPWDWRVLEFPDKSRHPQLQLDHRSTAFGRVDIMAFRQLILGLSQAAGGAAQYLQAAKHRYQPAHQRLQQGTQAIQQQLQNELGRQNLLQQQLNSARAAVPPDTNLIGDLQRRLNTTEAKLEELKRRMRLLEKGDHLLQQNRI